jgi:hypothetical protein
MSGRGWERLRRGGGETEKGLEGGEREREEMGESGNQRARWGEGWERRGRGESDRKGVRGWGEGKRGDGWEWDSEGEMSRRGWERLRRDIGEGGERPKRVRGGSRT